MVGWSQSLALAATAMAVSTTAVILAFSRHSCSSDPLPAPPPPPPKQQQQPPLRSCLATPESKRRRPKKKVKFAVKLLLDEEPPERELPKLLVNKERSYIDRIISRTSCCRTIMMPLPPNRVIALYNAILKDRGCSH